METGGAETGLRSALGELVYDISVLFPCPFLDTEPLSPSLVAFGARTFRVREVISGGSVVFLLILGASDFMFSSSSS